jgi:hypothetical protein
MTWSNKRAVLSRGATGLGLLISSCRSPWGNEEAIRVIGFNKSLGAHSILESSGIIQIGDFIVGVNGFPILHLLFKDSVAAFSRV